MSNRLCELLQIEHPIIQGAMAWVSTAGLAAAVSNSGGLGMLAAGNLPASQVADEIRKTRKLTDKPFGVNVMLMSPFAQDVMKVVLEERPAVVMTGAGNPAMYIPKLKEAGIKVIPVIPSAKIADKMEKAGADAVVAEGMEAGGHIGQITTMALVPEVEQAVNIPVIAAGGICDAHTLAAAFALGADGVQIGTRFICSSECEAHANYKQAILDATDKDVTVVGKSASLRIRLLQNKLTQEYQRMEEDGASPSEIERLGMGGLRKACLYGDVEYGSLMAGQSAARVREIKPCAQIIHEMLNDVPQILKIAQEKQK